MLCCLPGIGLSLLTSPLHARIHSDLLVRCPHRIRCMLAFYMLSALYARFIRWQGYSTYVVSTYSAYVIYIPGTW